MAKILENISVLAEKEGITIGALEKKIGASKGVLSRAIANGTDIQAKWIQAIVENYPHFSAEWLLTGNGEMIKGVTLPVAHQTENPKEGIPLIPAEAVAGIFAGEVPVSPDEYQYYYVPVFKNASYLLPIKGDSMMPTYQSGDIVACQLLPLNDIFFQWGKTYIVDTEQGALIKRVFQGSTNDKLKLVSDNAKYPPFEIPLNTIYHIALVLGIIRAE